MTPAVTPAACKGARVVDDYATRLIADREKRKKNTRGAHTAHLPRMAIPSDNVYFFPASKIIHGLVAELIEEELIWENVQQYTKLDSKSYMRVKQ